MMTPTNEQIKAEARRRAIERYGCGGMYNLTNFIIEVMRENWTPPEPVDPDLLTWREWAARLAGARREVGARVSSGPS